jgi:hypothetical protein
VFAPTVIVLPTLAAVVEGAAPIPNAKLLPAIVTVVFPAQVNVPKPETAVVLANAIIFYLLKMLLKAKVC